jgi:hypothetical protein
MEKRRRTSEKIKRQCLHARTTGAYSPSTNRIMEFHAPLPKTLRRYSKPWKADEDKKRDIVLLIVAP